MGEQLSQFPGEARRVLRWFLGSTQAAPQAVLLRLPLHEPDSLATADLDLLVFDASDDLLIERAVPPWPGAPTLDVIHLHAGMLQDSARLADAGLITHRVVASQVVADTAGIGRAMLDAVRAQWLQPAPTQRRVAGFLEMARLTVRELGVARDFPALGLFFLQMAHAACGAAVLDASGRPCPNIYTRPFLYAGELEALTGQALAAPLQRVLQLDIDPASLEEPLRALHREATRRCPEPHWPAAIRSGTRSEFRYWQAPGELSWRIRAAREMALLGNAAGAVFYLRYCAYSLARLAMVHQRATEGSTQHVSFIRPERAVLPDLTRHHPALLAPLHAALGGPRALDSAHVDAALAHLQSWRVRVLEFLARRGLDVAGVPAWRPYEAASHSPSSHLTTDRETHDGELTRPAEPALR